MVDVKMWRIGAVAMIAAFAMPTFVSAQTYVYVAATKDGVINGYSMDETSGILTPLQPFDVGGMVAPMALGPKNNMLYAGVRSQPFRVLSLSIDPDNGTLTSTAVAALPDNMAYISVDPTGRNLFGASYGGGTAAVVPIADDGAIKAGTRQFMNIGKNAHSILSDTAGRYVYSATLGSDEIHTFRHDPDGLLTQIDVTKTPSGSGPRHMVFAPDGKTLYVLTELSGEVIRYDVDPQTGKLTEQQRLSIIPSGAGLQMGLPPGQKGNPDDPPRIWAADIVLTPDGRQLFTSERTQSLIAQIDIADDGTMRLGPHYDTEKQPRDMAIDPSGKYLIAAGEKSDHIAVYRRDATQLSLVGKYPVAAGAGWVEVFSADN